MWCPELTQGVMGTNLRWDMCLVFSLMHSVIIYWALALVQTSCETLGCRDKMSWYLAWENFFPSWEKRIQTPLQGGPAQGGMCRVSAQLPPGWRSGCQVFENKFWEPRFFSVAGFEHSRNSKLHLRCWLFHFKKNTWTGSGKGLYRY